MIDHETRTLIKSIRDGAIRSEDRVRELLNSARSEIDRESRLIDEDRSLLHDAEQAFVLGWATV